MKSDCRSIMIMGRDWKSILGPRAEYLEVEVGIALVGPCSGPMADRLRDFQVMSANADTAIPVVGAILDYLLVEAAETAKIAPQFKKAYEKLYEARAQFEFASALYNTARSGK